MVTSSAPLVLLASARKESNTRLFVQKVFQETPHQLVDLLDHHIWPYRYENDYPGKDDFKRVMDLVVQHSVVVFATPVYWYAMSGLLKTFFDRLTDVVTVQKPVGRQLKGKTVFLIAVGADSELPDGFEMPFKLTAKYLNMKFGRTLYASTEEVETDISHPGDIREFLREIQDTLNGIN
ncbi:flavodoxin family protein [Rufibacter latericius]|uniref:NADPH-dependent oxidoreductase n=1 Tax=Rufibacter latericius TaxID=2487040 RepID=A0A3M9MX25_9BACT|nr:NAD(P)H-dependent oxidoreductase [Rufibacter latericius]RNI29318.1 NADPH-dependent oxidoreductase [Rufibacter latericius]